MITSSAVLKDLTCGGGIKKHSVRGSLWESLCGNLLESVWRICEKLGGSRPRLVSGNLADVISIETHRQALKRLT